MFPRIVTTKRRGKAYRYLAVVESYREQGKIKQRQIGNLGNIDQYSQQEILSLINKLREFLHDNETGTIHDIVKYGDKAFGIPYVVNFFWHELGLPEFFKRALKDRQVEIDVELCAKLLVIHRLSAPGSKLAASEWFKDVFLPELDGQEAPDIHQLYRSLDYLLDMKESLEQHLYNKLTDLFSLKLSLVFYDLTSSYFEGARCNLGRYGYSRDHRPDRLQINIGLLVTPEGLPLAHRVYPGNITDKTTVADSLKVLKESFNVEECIFVGDRGMITADNLLAINEAGFRYILGYHKRGRDVSDRLLDRYQNLDDYVTIPGEDEDGLLYLEINENLDEDPPGTRYLLCHNPLKAVDDRLFRERALDEAKQELAKLAERLAVQAQEVRRGRKITTKGVMLQVSDILKAKRMERFFTLDYSDAKGLTFSLDEAAIHKESLRDGKFLVKTDADLPALEVIQGYKNLMMVENAFREIKNLVRLRPIFHYNDNRVKAHVLVCVLAYLFEQYLAVLYDRYIEGERAKIKLINDPELREKALATLKEERKTGRRLLRELARMNATDQSFIGKRIYSIPAPDKNQAKIFQVLKVPLPPKVIVRD